MFSVKSLRNCFLPADLFWEPVKGLHFALGLMEEPNKKGVHPGFREELGVES